MHKIRVLHLVSSLARGSGVMSVIMNYYRHINRDKVQFDFIYFKEVEESYKEEIYNLGGNVYFINKIRLNIINDFFKNNAYKYKVFHNHEVYLNFIFAPLVKKYGIKYRISHSHTTIYSDKKKSAFRNRILCLPLKIHSNIYFACSNEAGRFLYGNRLVDKNRVYILNNAIDCDKFKFNLELRNKIRSELKLEDKLVLGHIGRFNEQKNHRFLIDVFYEISKINSNAVLILVGEGPLYDEILEKVKKLGLQDKVLFLGIRRDVEKILNAIDIIIMPSLFEGLPVIGIEAQCSGCKCYMSNKITKEVNLVNVEFLSLDVSKTTWAQAIENGNNLLVRKSAFKVVEESNFSIKLEAKKLEEYYIAL